MQHGPDCRPPSPETATRVEAAKTGVHGAHADPELLRDLFVGQSQGNASHGCTLRLSQPVMPIQPALYWHRAPPVAALVGCGANLPLGKHGRK